MRKITPFLWFDRKAEEAMNFYASVFKNSVDELWDKVSAGGEEQLCGWLKDKYGMSWQIIPSLLGTLLGDKDGAKAQRYHPA